MTSSSNCISAVKSTKFKFCAINILSVSITQMFLALPRLQKKFPIETTLEIFSSYTLSIRDALRRGIVMNRTPAPYHPGFSTRFIRGGGVLHSWGDCHPFSGPGMATTLSIHYYPPTFSANHLNLYYADDATSMSASNFVFHHLG